MARRSSAIAANEAGLPQCSAHGLRKAAATRLANAGCSTDQIKAITGHKALSEVARHTKAADQQRLARQALSIQLGAEQEQDLFDEIREITRSGKPWHLYVFFWRSAVVRRSLLLAPSIKLNG